MANSVTLTKLLEGKRHLVIKVDFNIDSTAELTDQVICDPNGTGDTDPVPKLGAVPCLTVEETWHSINNFDVQFEWDAATDVKAFTLSSKTGDAHFDFRTWGGIKDLGGTTPTGKLQLTTLGCTANTSQGFVILKLRKDWPANIPQVV